MFSSIHDSNFMGNRINANAMEKRHYCHSVNKDHMRVAEFSRNLIDFRDCFERDGKCIFSKKAK